MIADYDLTPHNTFGLAATARFGVPIVDAVELPPLLGAARAFGLPLRILGGGSNVVLRPRLESIVGLMQIAGRDIVGRDGGDILVRFGAGETWHDIVAWTVGQGLGGLENLAGIPGTVGAAPIQNIGAYGVELVERFHALEAYDTVDEITRRFDRDDCGFSYRQSVFKTVPGRFIVTEVTLALPSDWRADLRYPGLTELPADSDPQTVFDTVVAVRNRKLPDWRLLGNAGSFFHNPIVAPEVADRIAAAHPGAPRYPADGGQVKLSAGWLIEHAGFKGHRLGAAGVYENHALVMVNHGGATEAEVSALAAEVVAGVEQKFGVRLVQEPERL